MPGTVRFVLGDRVVEVSDPDPTTTVLQWLRAQGRTGTKEGCAEGDCGACTVVLGSVDDGRISYRAVNACILFLPMLDGRQLLTVEDLREPRGPLHPVQQALVDHHGSQCGFCTPGFVMSLFAEFHREEGLKDEEGIQDALAGNLCRCTGYRPILDAARRVGAASRADRFAVEEPRMLALLEGLRRDTGLALTGPDGRRWFAPRCLAELQALLDAHPDATLLAGATDVGLWVTKQHRRPDPVVWLGDVAELRRIAQEPDRIVLGAGVSYAAALPVLASRWPAFGALVRRLGSAQIRNSGTIGGNIANASPIGDGMPALIALGARLILNRAGLRRTIPIEDYFLGYRRTALLPGEFLEAVEVPSVPGGTFATYKVSKRRDQDISAVAAGFSVTLEEGVVTEARLAFGGMAEIPKRAAGAEAALVGRPWTLETVAAAMEALGTDFAPLNDMRASAAYRILVARNLLMRFHLESTGQAELLEAADA
ncbi:xanthine dehydrogenase small subunit [Arenibaculum pallidiluteum]|uniref:xanthine dehydrogenase small subunit n=1 Tax=Arenibaculum pallidiluteum TaxID=2812559 RepID=UPI001A95D005|nr:xanthine dehydrogenase small subunit [Arenibaculum pallidiluteum]